MEYKCPLCDQPVSKSVFDRITGIWKARQEALDKIKKQGVQLNQKFKLEKKRLAKKLAEERKKFAQKRTVAIKKAVDAKTRKFGMQIATLRQKEARIKKQTQRQIQRAVSKAHAKDESKFNDFKKQQRTTIQTQLRREREHTRTQVEQKYGRLNQSFRHALGQMQIKDKTIREQNKQIKELGRQIERHTTPQLEGLLYEGQLAKELKKRFPKDGIRHTGKGGDVLQTVMRGKQMVGLIVYECKRVKHYSTKHIRQAAEAKKKRNANFAMLVTNAMKKGTQGFFVERGVVVVHATGVMSVAGILRNQIVQIARMKLGQLQREKAVKLILNYLEGPEFTNSMDTIIQEALAVHKELIDECKKHKAWWGKRCDAYGKIRDEAFAAKSKSRDLLSGKTSETQTEKLPTLERPFEVEISPKVSLAKKKPVGIAVVEAGDDNVKEA